MSVAEHDPTMLTPEQRQRVAEGHSVLSWEYADGSCGWEYGSHADVWRRAASFPLDVALWINGYHLTPCAADPG